MTVGQVAKLLDAPQWRVRRLVDEVAPTAPRAGLYRLIEPRVVELVRQRLEVQEVTK
jgi:hypothetical protein